MAVSNVLETKSVRERVGEREWQARVELAAAYRLVAQNGWTNLVNNHISLRVPGTEDQFLINPYGPLYEQITASSLVRIDVDGNILDETPYKVNQAGFVIHRAIHMARKDLHCVLHTHTVPGQAVSALDCGLLPLNQAAMRFYNRIGYHDFEGIANDVDESELARRRVYFEGVSTQSTLAILYLNSGMRERPESHFKYLALAQALAEVGHQYDVLYGGDGIYSSDVLDLRKLAQYKGLLIPEAGNLTEEQVRALAEFSGELIVFAQSQSGQRLSHGNVYDEAMLFRFWREYRDEDRQNIMACVSPHTSTRILTSHPLVNVIGYAKDGEQILHIVNYQYDAAQDHVSPVENLRRRVSTTPRHRAARLPTGS